MEKAVYPSDVTDRQWEIIAPLFPAAKAGGRPRTVDLRQVVNGILYINRGGCAWRMLPKEYGSWETVYGYFWRFRRDGIWQCSHDSLREKVRRADERKPAVAERARPPQLHLLQPHMHSVERAWRQRTVLRKERQCFVAVPILIEHVQRAAPGFLL
jgi:transposase